MVSHHGNPSSSNPAKVISEGQIFQDVTVPFRMAQGLLVMPAGKGDEA
jgi:hypothetical protein